MRTSIENGDAEMLRMLINAKADVGNCGNNVSCCINGIFGRLCTFCTKRPAMF